MEVATFVNNPEQEFSAHISVPLTWTVNISAAGRMAIGIPIRLIRAIDTNAVCASKTLCDDDKTNVMKHSSATW